MLQQQTIYLFNIGNKQTIMKTSTRLWHFALLSFATKHHHASQLQNITSALHIDIKMEDQSN